MPAKRHESPTPISVRQVEIYRRVRPQIKAMLDEVRELSKKKPDGVVNKFKLGFINEKLEEANAVLGDEGRPLKQFTQFEVDSLPSNSDVVMILSQYMGALTRWQKTYTYKDAVFKEHWRTDPPLAVD